MLADARWNKVLPVCRWQFSLVSIVAHASSWLMHRYQQKGQSLQEFNFEFSKLIQAVTNCDPKDTTYLFKNYMDAQKVFNPATGSKTINPAHLTLQTSHRLCTKDSKRILTCGRSPTDRIWLCSINSHNFCKLPIETAKSSNYDLL